MRNTLITFCFVLYFYGFGLVTSVQAEPVPLIFDTDITGDVDDVLALAMIHALADRQECELKAVTISKLNPLTGRFVEAVNTYYGRAEIPIGVTRDSQIRQSKYLKLIQTKDGEEFRYPHSVKNNDELPSAVEVLRSQLAAAEDHSIVIVQVGLATNLADLLQSSADEQSPLTGVELVRKKVKLLSVMAGAFRPVNGNAHFLEANVVNGISAMQRFAALSPAEVPIVWSDFLIGISTAYPRESIHNDFEYQPHHIVKEAYLLHSGPNHDRPSWDLTSVLIAVRPEDDYFGLSPRGIVSVDDDGFTQFTPQADGRDRYMTLSKPQAVRVVEALRMLVSQPPVK